VASTRGTGSVPDTGNDSKRTATRWEVDRIVDGLRTRPIGRRVLLSSKPSGTSFRIRRLSLDRGTGLGLVTTTDTDASLSMVNESSRIVFRTNCSWDRFRRADS